MSPILHESLQTIKIPIVDRSVGFRFTTNAEYQEYMRLPKHFDVTGKLTVYGLEDAVTNFRHVIGHYLVKFLEDTQEKEVLDSRKYNVPDSPLDDIKHGLLRMIDGWHWVPERVNRWFSVKLCPQYRTVEFPTVLVKQTRICPHHTAEFSSAKHGAFMQFLDWEPKWT